MTEVLGARLRLRPFRATDEAAVHRYAADPEVTRYTDWGPNSPAETAAFLREALDPPPSVHQFAVELRASGEMIGGASIRVVDEHGEFGYAFARAHWGQGYATEAARLLVDYGFGPLGLERIAATCAPENLASARVLSKAGLRQIDYLTDHLPVRGGWRDSLLFEIKNSF
ncbi:GNAT family N-acetyltransferase [Cryptosporangium sp. NPDC048952]|uniref:GNAT family N-acetyltransferase n=1 Tax=Cryptosporangium sp. NPDC048952 TaxID=3363961 RepID=UPI003722A677